jgi:hypothetical protein
MLMETHNTDGAVFNDNVADRILIADVFISDNNSYPASASTGFSGVDGGFILPHLSAHLNNGAGVPVGGNRVAKDGHAAWKKFNSAPAGFTPGGAWSGDEDAYTLVRTSSGPWFWW